MNQVNQRTGCLYGVGVGPGDPELITLKAFRVLARTPVIFVPKKDNEATSFARSIINGLIREEQQVIELVFPMLKDREKLTVYWKDAADTIWRHLSAGQDCAFINIGDPLFYGTFIHVLDAIRENHQEITIEVIPGISSPHAATARALVPMAVDNDRVAIVSLPCEDTFIRKTLEDFDTIIFMKLSHSLDQLLTILEETNLIDNSIYIKRCTTDEEEVVQDIKQLKGIRPDYFSLLIVRR